MRKYDDLIALLREADADECNEAASAIEALLKERDAALETVKTQEQMLDDHDALIEQLNVMEVERDAALVDARRYRWLRDNHETTMKALEIVCECEGFKWDAAIDAAMQEKRDE